MNYELIVTLNAIFAVGCALAAEQRNDYPLAWFVLGMVFGPLAFIASLTGRKRCQYCLSVIPKELKVCRFCQKEL